MIRRVRRPAPNANGTGYTPGITSAGVAGQTPPALQGLPVPLPPADLPGRHHLLPALHYPDGSVTDRLSTILNIRNLKLPAVSRTALVVGTVVVLAIVGGLIGWNVYKKLSTNTVVAYFPDTLALPFDPLGALVQARATLLTSWSVSAC